METCWGRRPVLLCVQCGRCIDHTVSVVSNTSLTPSHQNTQGVPEVQIASLLPLLRSRARCTFNLQVKAMSAVSCSVCVGPQNFLQTSMGLGLVWHLTATEVEQDCRVGVRWGRGGGHVWHLTATVVQQDCRGRLSGSGDVWHLTVSAVEQDCRGEGGHVWHLTVSEVEQDCRGGWGGGHVWHLIVSEAEQDCRGGGGGGARLASDSVKGRAG